MSTSIEVGFSAYGLSSDQAQAMFDLFERTVREEGFGQNVDVVRQESRRGGFDVRVVSVRSITFSGFRTWRPEFEEQLQQQVNTSVPGVDVSFEWGYPELEPATTTLLATLAPAAAATAAAATCAPPPTNWAEFVPRLETMLSALPDGAVVSLSAGEGWCVQFLAEWVCTITGSRTPDQERLLTAAGWQAPMSISQIPAWQLELSRDSRVCEQVAARACEAISQVLGIAVPTEMTVEAWNDYEGPDPEIAILGL
ncbi:hypothetical protein GPX89_09285 [Nocardia sp. ET3-3]|uniref:TY-Chap N-terminal domain-containing protein n=1 Tax=Nocardia terrae TaxID=2675851 RepID=A0A7K1USX6_9NOCA|nr:hypothetical protein [Nocardia terrae]MVU77440.1 hypothetical protein [Nocardia terrae]